VEVVYRKSGLFNRRNAPSHRRIPSARAVGRVTNLLFDAALGVSLLRVVLEHLRLGLTLLRHALFELAVELAKWLDLLRGGHG
jgi:hypothetical protein